MISSLGKHPSDASWQLFVLITVRCRALLEMGMRSWGKESGLTENEAIIDLANDIGAILKLV